MLRLILFIAGLVLLIALILQLGLQNILSVILRMHWNILWVTLIYGASEMIRAAALTKSLPQGEPQTYWNMLKVRLAGEAAQYLTFTGPFIGEPLKAWLLHKTGLPMTKAFAAVLTEYLAYTFISAAIGIAGIWYMLGHLQPARGITVAAQILLYCMAGFLVVSAIAIGFRIYVIGAVIDGIRKLPLGGTRVPWSRHGVREMEDWLFDTFRAHPERFATILLLDCAAHGLLICELYWIVSSSGVSLRMFDAFLIEATTKFMSLAFFFIPMQVGVAEMTYSAVFTTLQLPIAAAVAMSLVRRLRALIVSTSGLIALALMKGD